MQDTSLGDVAFEVDLHPFPHHDRALAAPTERAHPCNGDVVAEGADRIGVVRHCVIREEPAHDVMVRVRGTTPRTQLMLRVLMPTVRAFSASCCPRPGRNP